MGIEASIPFFSPQKFPTLAPLFGKDAKVPLIGLLFSAAWCPDCQPVVPKLALLLSEEKEVASYLLKIVYVGSEKTDEEMKEFLKRSSCDDLDEGVFTVIDFDNVNERQGLKKHFKTCAAKEMKDVGLEKRSGGIPTLKILDAKTATVVLEDAVPDLQKLSPSEVMKKWQALVKSD
mmetsp:Transcript_16237/g.21249  ORF Transcript_16237/g.21249 Transcript_16237/m.21249 type:complete len:176 (+) Transcript_16237:142-669(+)